MPRPPASRVAAAAAALLLLTAAPPARAGFITLDAPGAAILTTASGASGSTVVGSSLDANLVPRGFLYDIATGTYTTLDHPDAGTGFFQGTRAIGVSGSTVAGSYTDANDVAHGFLYNTTTGTYTTFDYATPPGPGGGTYLQGVSGGTVLGVYFPDFFSFGQTVLYAGGAFTTPDVPGFATGIDGSTLVGYYSDADGVSHGYLYDITTGTTTTLPDDPAAGTGVNSGVYASGASGSTVVGYVYNPDAGQFGFVYDGSAYAPLATPGNPTGRDVFPNGVDGSTVVGTYFDASGNQYGFVLTPAAVPEPASAALLGAGGLGLLARAARRRRAASAAV